WLAEELEERSEGRLKVEMYPNSSLVSIDQNIESLANGSIDMAYALPNYYVDVLPTGLIGNLPFMTTGIDDALYLINETEIGVIFREEFTNAGAKPLVTTTAPAYSILSNVPIHSLDDMNGILLRSSGGVLNSWYGEIGVN